MLSARLGKIGSVVHNWPKSVPLLHEALGGVQYWPSKER